MKKLFLSIILCLCYVFSNAQWSGSTNDTGLTYRTGQVRIGNTISNNPINSNFRLSIDGNLITPSFIFYANSGDLRMRRFEDGDLTYKRALVPIFLSQSNTSKLGINYSGDFTEGVQIYGPELIIDGNVGIGTNTPGAKLHVNGEAIFKPDFVNHNFIKISSNSINQTNLTFLSQNTAKWNLYSNDESFHFRKAGSNAAEVMVLDSNGNVGIGTTSPSEKLTVNGKILCEEVEVIQDVAPDYVFQKYYTGESSLKEDYVMPTLEEVEAFTKENHHLPEVPSAAEIKEEGLQLKEMTTILLQKVEELTLYTIEQEKRIKALEAELAKKQ